MRKSTRTDERHDNTRSIKNTTLVSRYSYMYLLSLSGMSLLNLPGLTLVLLIELLLLVLVIGLLFWVYIDSDVRA